jgi:hypothetical protein
MWCAQVAFWFPFELALPAGGYPISSEGRRAMLDILSGRCSRTTVVVPAADRPPDNDRHTWEIHQGTYRRPTDVQGKHQEGEVM